MPSRIGPGSPAGGPGLPDLVYLVHEPDNEGLQYSLRSVDRFARGMFGRIFLAGPQPGWTQGVEHVVFNDHLEKFASIRAKLTAVCEDDRVADRIVVMNDDFFATREVTSWTPTHMGSTSAYLEKHDTGRNTWYDAMRQTAEWMAARGHGDILCYAGHIPLMYDRRKLGALLAEYPADRRVLDCGLYPEAGVGGVGTMGPNTKISEPSVEALRAKLPDLSNPPLWLSSSDESFAGALGAHIRAMFPEPGPYEIPGGMMHEYEIFIGGISHTVLLSDAQARERGITPYSERGPSPIVTREPKQAEAKPNKARKPRNKASGKS